MRNKIALFGLMAIFVVLAVPAASAHLDYVNIGDPASEAGHNLQGWSYNQSGVPFTGSNYGGGDDGTFRLLMGPGDGCGDAYRNASFTMAASETANQIVLRHLDGSQNDDFDLYIVESDGTYTKIGNYAHVTTTEDWVTSKFDFSGRTGTITFVLNSTGSITTWCNAYGQVAFSWARLSVGCIDEIDIGNSASEADHNLTGWSPPSSDPSVPFTGSNYGGGSIDGTFRLAWWTDDNNPNATFELDFGEAGEGRSLIILALDGFGNDSYTVKIDDTSIGSYLDAPPTNDPEEWHATSFTVPQGVSGVQTVTITATGEKWSGFDTYGQLAVSYVCLQKLCVPGIDVEKMVWDQVNETWAKSRVAKVCDTMRFNCTIHAKCCNLTNIVVTDNLSDSLEYVGNAIPKEPDEVIPNPDGTTTLKWYFNELKKCSTTYIEFDAHKIKVCNNNNTINVTAWCNETKPIQVSNQSTADIICGDVEKPDLVITDKWMCWPDNCTICYNITNIGNGTAPASHNTTLYVDNNETAHDIVPVELASNTSYIGCFKNYTLNHTVTNNWTYTLPSDNITICADYNETIAESNETNNCRTENWMCGDVRKDGSITGRDVSKLNRYVAGLGELEIELKWAGDVHTDGSITGRDVSELNRKVAGVSDISCVCQQSP